MKGTVKWFNIRKNFGFIKGDDGEDYFVHRKGLEEGIFLHENDRVEFEAIQTDKGKQAQKVILIEEKED